MPVKRGTDEVWQLLDRVLEKHPLLVLRAARARIKSRGEPLNPHEAPTWERLGTRLYGPMMRAGLLGGGPGAASHLDQKTDDMMRVAADDIRKNGAPFSRRPLS